MLLTDKSALEKAREIVSVSGEKADITSFFWVAAEDEKDDIFCYYVTLKGEDFEYPPGVLFPLFKRNGEMTDYILPIPA